MKTHNTLIWLYIYLGIIYRNKLIECKNVTVPESGESDDTNTESSLTSEVLDEKTSSTEQAISDSGYNASLPSPESGNMTLYDDRRLVSMVQLLSKFQLIDLVDLLNIKLKRLDDSYNFENDLNTFVEKVTIYLHPIIINVSELSCTGDYEWKTMGDTIVYTSNEGYGFKLVRHNKDILWHTTIVNHYATKIECDHKNHTVTIHKSDNKIETFPFKPEQEAATNSTTYENLQGSTIRNPTVLNISEIKNCDEYTWTVSNDVITCTANGKYGFKLVRQNRTVIWHTINTNNYSTMVECDTKNHTVTVHKLDKTKDTSDYEPEGRESTLLITVDIANKRNNDLYTYQRRGNRDVFGPIKPYLVNRITNGFQMIWWFKDGTYPHEIEVTDEIEGKRSLVLYFRSKTIEFFTNDGDEIMPVIRNQDDNKHPKIISCSDCTPTIEVEP